MIDIKLLQKDFDKVSNALIKKGVDVALLEDIKNDVVKTKAKRQQMEEIQAKQNALSSQFGAYKKDGKDIAPLKQEIDILKKQKQSLEEEVRTAEEILTNKLMGIPNIPDDNVPLGKDENEMYL